MIDKLKNIPAMLAKFDGICDSVLASTDKVVHNTRINGYALQKVGDENRSIRFQRQNNETGLASHIPVFPGR